MLGTFDVGCTDSSTLVNNESKHDQDMTTTTAEEDKTETADPSAENYDSGDVDYNDDDDNDENGSDGEEEEGIDESTKLIEQCNGDNDDDDNDEDGSDGEQEEGNDESTKQIEKSNGDNDDDDNDENGSDGEEEEWIDESTKQIEQCNGDIENEEKDDKSADDEQDKMIIDGSNKKHKENKADVNTAKNDISINSDDIIPSENTLPDGNNSSITPSTIEMSHSETTQKNRDTEMGPSSTIQSVDIGQTQKTEEGKKPEMKRRLGMGGLAFTKKTLQVSMQDISIDSDKLPNTQDTEKLEGGKESVMRKLMCTKCPEMFFTWEGYQRHLFKDHKVWCFDKHPPQVIEKIVMRCSEETYETNYRVINTKISDKGDEAVPNTDTNFQHIDSLEKETADENVEEEGNVTTKSGEQSWSKENDQNIENIIVKSEGPSKKNRKGKKPRGKKSHLTSRKKKTVIVYGEEESESLERLRKAIQNVYAINKEKPTVKCIGCETYFHTEDGMKTHFQNAHTNLTGSKGSVINDSETDETLNEASTLTNAPDTAESELPDIVPPTQTVTRG